MTKILIGRRKNNNISKSIFMAQATLCQMTGMNNEMGRMWKEVDVAYSEVLSMHLLERITKTMKHIRQESCQS
jgi:hypothetical protein